MFDFKYENQGTNTYLVYSVLSGDIVDTLSLGMLTNNNIPGLAKALFTQLDDVKYIKYNVSAKISMQQFFDGVVNRKRLLGVFGGIVDGLMSAEDYMIDTSCIILNPAYIFVDVSTCVSTLICLPITNIVAEKPDLGAFFKNIMMNTQFDQTENLNHVAKIFNFLNSSPVFSPIDFKKLLDELKNEIKQPSTQSMENKLQRPVQKQENVSQPAPVVNSQPRVSPVVPPVQPKPQPSQQPVTPINNNVVVPPPVQAQSTMSSEPEKKISMFGLLMHYSKENKALYEQQKAVKKMGNGIPNKQPIPQQQKQPAMNPGFAVPGMNQTTDYANFAIPGQSAMKQPTPGQTSVPPVAPPMNQNRPNTPPVASSMNQNRPYTPPVAPQTNQNKPYTPPVAQPMNQNTPVTPATYQNTPVVQPAYQSKPYTPPVVSQEQSVNFGETTVLGGGVIGETTVLNAVNNSTQTITPHLIRKKNNEKIFLDKPIIRVGKERSYVDYFIGDNAAISRSHANFITRDGECFVVDTNSTNHTFINETMIQSNVESLLTHGDIIRLANEEFEFKLY